MPIGSARYTATFTRGISSFRRRRTKTRTSSSWIGRAASGAIRRTISPPLLINYLFFSLQRSERLEGGFATLFSRFWQRYLDATGDTELQAVVAPFFAFRGLVVANPVWYPGLTPGVRRKLLNFVRAVLDTPAFDPTRVNAYCGGR